MKSSQSCLRLSLCLSLLFCLPEAQAFTFKITNRAYPNGNQAAMDALADAMESQFNDSIASTNKQSSFLNSVGNANAASARSYISPGVLPADSNFFVNFGGTAALALGDGASLSNGISLPSNQLPPMGVGASAGATLGLPGRILHPPFHLDPKRVQYMLSFYKMNLSKLIGHGVSVDSTEFGAGMSYQLYTSKPWTPLVRYNGIRIASGLTYSKFDASYTTAYSLSQFDSGTGATMSWNSNVDVGVSSGVFTLSTEATTGVCFLWVFNLYSGLGLDFNFGSSSITGGSSGPVKAVQGNTTYFTGTGTVSGSSESVAPTLVDVRFLLGTEIDLGAFGIYIQGQAATPSVYALNLGAHFGF